MKIKIIESGKHRISDDMLIFSTEEGQVEIDLQSAKEITWTLLDVLFLSSIEIDEIIGLIEDKLYKRGDL